MGKSNILFIGEVFNGLKEIIYLYSESNYEITFLEEEKNKNKTLNRAKYLLTGNDEIGKEILAEANNAVLVQNTGVGCDNIDLDFAKEKKIPVANAPKSNSVAVSELTIALILSLYRKITYFDKATKYGEWHMWDLRNECFELNGKKHGIIGFGEAGKKVATRSKAFGTTIYYHDKIKASKEEENNLGVEYLPLENLLSQSDIISIHVPLIPETENLISKAELNMMKENALIINVSRGGIVNETDLYNSLISKEIAGCALDVWKEEPINDENPLLKLEQVIATPHIGAGTIDTMKRVYKICFDNINRMEHGNQPQHIVSKY